MGNVPKTGEGNEGQEEIKNDEVKNEEVKSEEVKSEEVKSGDGKILGANQEPPQTEDQYQ
jgi:hypothetical protein